MITFEFFSKSFSKIKLTSVTSIKNIILFSWIYLLLAAGINVANGSFISGIEVLLAPSELIKSNESSKEEEDKPVRNPSKEMDNYISKNYYHKLDEAPPLGIVIDQIQINQNWRNPTKDLVKSEYLNLFKTVESRLKAIAISNTNELGSIEIEATILPKRFRGEGFEPQFKANLPLEAQSWIRAEQKRINQEAVKLELLNTFFLLIILGAFGSLIFLIREHMENEHDILIKSYIYRPILGMYLAVAIFITDASIHTLISQGEIHEMRRETLFLLSFAAGLVAEQAYSLIVQRAKKVLKNESENKEDESENEQLDEQELRDE